VSFPAGSNAEDIALAINNAYPNQFNLGSAYSAGVLQTNHPNIVFHNVGEARAQAAAHPGTAAIVEDNNVTLSAEAIALGQNGGHITWTNSSYSSSNNVFSVSFPAGSNAGDIALAINNAYPNQFNLGYGHTDGVLQTNYPNIVFEPITSANANVPINGSSSSSSSSSSNTGEAGDNARAAITLIDDAIRTVNIQRSKLGAVSNRLSHTVNNLTNISSNLSAAQGGIEDADFAKETTDLAKNQILQQASTAMLAQANASKQNVLSLLQG
jgi:flagellin-like hook-associated protein FlgL